MNILKRVSALCAAGVLCLTCVSCGKEAAKKTEEMVSLDIPDNITIDEKDMPYGTTLVELKASSDENVKVTTEFDRRFVTNEEAYVISEYLWGLSKKDEATVRKTFYPELLDYTWSMGGKESAAEYIESSYDNLKDALGGDFEFTYLDITAADTPESLPGPFEDADLGLKKCGSEDISDRITSRKLVTLSGLTMYSLSDGTEKLVSGALSSPISLCIYKIDGQYYIV